MRRQRGHAVGSVLCALWLSGCSAEESQPTRGASMPAGAAGAAAAFGAPRVPESRPAPPVTSSQPDPSPPAMHPPASATMPAARSGNQDVCARDRYPAEQRPLTIYTLFDESISMLTWWSPVTEAFTAFVRDPRSAGINIGLKFFGTQCAPEFYSMPDVPIAALPQNADIIATTLANRIPLAQTPTAQAIEGATLALEKYATDHPDEKTIILLVTDASGGPFESDAEDCYSTTPQASQLAAKAHSAARPIETYVLGLGDNANLNMLSQAGGTGTALSADPSASAAVVDAMREIRSRALPCEYALPAGAEQDLHLVNLERIQSDGSTTTVPGVSNAGACDPTGGGWYYDDPKSPKQIVSCPATCASFAGAAEVNVVLGCPTIGPQ